MIIKIGIAQIKNTDNVESNFNAIMRSLKKFEETDTDLILFPECSLSGFSASIKLCNLEYLKTYLDSIDDWSKKHQKSVILPTAIVDSKIYNTGFIFGKDEPERFYKEGLTESEKGFFTLPKQKTNKVFKIKDFNIALLICYEVEFAPWTFFKPDEVDLILWPGYWGWEKEDVWQSTKKDGTSNVIFNNMKSWQRPLIQSNFSSNDLTDHRGDGPHGLSMFIDSNNKLFAQGEFEQESCYQVSIVDHNIQSFVKIN